MLYFYAPSYVFLDADGGESFRPGVQVGDAIEPAEMPLGATSPHYDRDLPRFVVTLPAGTAAPGAGWEQRTKEQVEADYPGVLGGA